MPKRGQKMVGKVGMTVGVIVIAASVLGGVVLAADLSRGRQDPGGSTVPVGDNSTPSGTPAADQSGESGATPGSTGGPGSGGTTGTGATTTTATHSQSPGSPTPTPTSTRTATPTPSLTCWPGPGEHPPGIEDCPGT